MLTSLAFVFLTGLAAASICQRIGLPRIIGMLIAGIVIGPTFSTFSIRLFSGFRRSQANGTHHYPAESWTNAEPVRFEKSWAACCLNVICPSLL